MITLTLALKAAGFRGEAFHILPVLLLGVTVDQFEHRDVGLDQAGVAALEQAMLAQPLENEFEGRLIDGRDLGGRG